MSSGDRDTRGHESGDGEVPAGQTFDPTVLTGLRTALGDDEFVLDIVQNFLAETPDRIAALTAAAGDGDAQSVAATAHRIKGSALTFGAPRLVNLCAAIEMSPGGSSSLVASVAHEFDDLCHSLTTYVDDVRAGGHVGPGPGE